MNPYYKDEAVTIYHGDAREILGSLAAGILVTDPPYGYGYASNKVGKFQREQIANDTDTTLRDWALDAWAGRPAIVFGSWKSQRPSGIANLLIWDKGEWVGMGDLSMPWGHSHEEIYVLGRGFSTEDKRIGSVLRFQNVVSWSGKAGQRNHPNEKPLPLMRHLLDRCPPGTVVDPFAGSGATLRAAKDLGRHAIGIEIEERYCEIAAIRMGQEVFDLAV
jgi:DNA modification methylase